MICKENGCLNSVSRKGWCGKHYQRFYKSCADYKPIKHRHFHRNHPLYIIWWQRKRDNLLCKAWLNFEQFVKDVGERPSKDHYLIRLHDGLFGPDNFLWKQHLRKLDTESFREWHARKRAHRIAANPSMESDRNLRRKYGLTPDQYNDILKSQNDVCAICRQPETSIDGRTGAVRKLAVDHCHKTNKIRGLLCWRCNGSIGRVEENINFLQSMIDYLNLHKE